MRGNVVRVLLVDDDEDDFIVTRELLAECDRTKFHLTWETSYEAGLARLQAEVFEVCLIDYRLGKHTGLELLTDARQQGITTTFILLTGQGDSEVDYEAMQAGAADYLIKAQLTSSLLERSIRYARKDAQILTALRVSEERYARVVRGANDGVWDWDLQQQEIYYSARWKGMLGYAEDEVQSAPEEWFRRVHPDDADALQRELAAHLAGHSPHFQHEHRMLHQDGSYRWMLSRGIAIRDHQQVALHIAGSQTDVTERRAAQDRLLHEALHDTLTELPNRLAFMERLRRSLERARHGSNYLFAVLFLDLDRFKIINDSLGHYVGDQVLVMVAKRLAETLRPSDMIARLGGDEFVILLDHLVTINDAAYIADRLQQCLAEPLKLGDREVFTTASIGITYSNDSYLSAEDLLRDADTAMYRAKGNGKARFEIFDQQMRENAMRLMQVETDLRSALDKRELMLHYQPIISLQTGRLAGFEALLRWQHQERGLISPAEFIPVAEENGLINPIGTWVLQEACRQMSQWHVSFPRRVPLTINVNLSGKQFSQLNLPDIIAEALAATSFDPRYLKLEITESLLMENAQQAAETLSHLKSLGSKLAIDDFGTGYSSFSHLHHFPIDTLKIDRSFVSRMDASMESAEIVRTILLLAHNLNMEVVAEGVETAGQLQGLQSLGCEYAQGFYIHRPMSATDASEFQAEEFRLQQTYTERAYAIVNG